MWRWYIARKFWKYRQIQIILGGIAFGVLLTVSACIGLSEHHPVELDGRRPDLIISGPLGEYRIYGANQWLEPVVRQGRMMNKIEAMENHAQWPEMSDRPEDYIGDR